MLVRTTTPRMLLYNLIYLFWDVKVRTGIVPVHKHVFPPLNAITICIGSPIYLRFIHTIISFPAVSNNNIKTRFLSQ